VQRSGADIIKLNECELSARDAERRNLAWWPLIRVS